MTFKHSATQFILIILASIILSACSINPFRVDNELTGSAAGTGLGAAAGAGTAILAGGSNTEIALAGLAGGALGYYVTSLPFTAGGVTHVGGHVYTLGDYVTIEIPTDQLFDVNSADFLPGAGAILDSTAAVLKRYPRNSIMISGNTSGFNTPRLERKLSEARARQVAAYLWAHGISNDNINNPNQNIAGMHDLKRYTRKLSFVGYGNYFPISNNITATGIRENSRIQITAYPNRSKIKMNQCGPVKDYSNVRETGDPTSATLSEIGNRNEISSYHSPNAQGYSPVDDDVKAEMSDSYNAIIPEKPCPVSSQPAAAEPCPVSAERAFRGYKGE